MLEFSMLAPNATAPRKSSTSPTAPRPIPSSTKRNYAKPTRNWATATMGRSAGSPTASTSSSTCRLTVSYVNAGATGTGARVSAAMGSDVSSATGRTRLKTG